MDAERKRVKQTLRNFMREHYTDAKLVELLQHARSGLLTFDSCCCFIGIPTADHELRGMTVGTRYHGLHCLEARRSLRGADAAEDAFLHLAHDEGYGSRGSEEDDPIRIRRLIPIILAEIRRRQRVTQESARSAHASV